MKNNKEEFSHNDKYLIAEYNKLGDGDYLLTDIGDKTFMVPYKYSVGAKDGKEAVEKFKTALLDFLSEDEKKIFAAGPQKQNKAFKKIVERAEVKYHAVINAHRQLGDKKPADFSSAALEKYTYKLLALGQTMCVSPNAEEQLKMYRFLCSLENKVSDKFKTSTNKLAKSLGKKILENEYKSLKKYRPKHWKVGLLAGMLAVSGYHFLSGSKEYIEQEKKVEVVPDTIPTYTDFMGNVHQDEFGNLQRINDLQPEIIATLLAIEGYAEEAFLEGGKNPTKGSGFTVTINEDGTTTKVKMGDVTTPEEDVMNNRRYIEREFIRVLGDSVGRELTNEEIMAGICAGYCWGTTAFEKSCFFQSIKNNETLEQQSRKISGFRKQLGLLKRGFLISQVLRGNWSAEDLLDLPIYLIKDKGYVHCSIYTLDLHECLPCKKDKNGKYLKDEKGNDVPILCQDDFCRNFYDDSDKKVLNKLIRQAKNGHTPYKTVRELMNDDMVDSIIHKEEKNPFDFDRDMFFAQMMQGKKSDRS